MDVGSGRRTTRSRWDIASGPWLAATATISILVCCGLTSPARAGTYPVLACDAAPGGVNHSWREHEDRGMRAATRCPSRGDPQRGLTVRNTVNSGTVRRGKGAFMEFRAPPGTTLAGIDLEWDGRRVNGDWRLGLVRGDGRLLAGCRARPGTDASCRVGNPKGGGLVRQGLAGTHLVRIEARCGSTAGCATDARSRAGDRTKARLAVHRASVHVQDRSLPNLTASGRLLGGGWLRGRVEAVVRAGDNVGVRSTALRTGGVTRVVEQERCDFTHVVPCPRNVQAVHQLDTSTLDDGRHLMALSAVDTAGNGKAIERTIAIDNHAPGRVSGIRVVGGDAVRSTNSFDVRWSPPPGQLAPIARAHYRLCRRGAPSECVQGLRAGGARGIDDLSVPRRGGWRLRVWLEDAAGNTMAATASAPVTLRFDDRSPARLDARLAWGGAPAASRTIVPFGARAVVEGTLTGADHRRVAGVPVAVATEISGAGRPRHIGRATTNGQGRFRFRLPAGPSRTVWVVFGGSDRYRPAAATAHLAVRAGSSLRVSRRRVSNGDRVTFRGRLLGGPIPREGKLVQLEAFYRDRWRTFAVVRSGSGGAWRRRYRFEATEGLVRYPFRVRIPHERSYPYAAGRSRVIRVTVDGR
jgi:hypothetical protein